MDYRKAFLLDGKVDLVTSGGSDIGAKIADDLSQAGASVLVTDIDATVGESLVKNI